MGGGTDVAIETADAALLKNRVTGWPSLWSYRERPFSTSAEHRAGAGPQGGFPRDYAGMPTAGAERARNPLDKERWLKLAEQWLEMAQDADLAEI
jgi:hypothetical protein